MVAVLEVRRTRNGSAVTDRNGGDQEVRYHPGDRRGGNTVVLISTLLDADWNGKISPSPTKNVII